MNESKTINFAIDLGTTNSVISKNEKGEAILFKNPVGQKETLPSVVGFRRERVIVGDKAREYLEKDSENVVGLFKRKMGTDHVYPIQSLDKSLSPVDLSAYVLKEIKNFVTTGEIINSVVITIPASFDTVQSNATKEAGIQAGFNEVILLQEPIAASLAFINQYVENNEESRKWVVYDLGGGTFDVALLSLEDGEIKVIDHKGDNFMGGLDFDNLIFEKLVIPHLQSIGNFPDKLIANFKSASGKYHKNYYQIIKKCEELKVSLSTSDVSEIEFEIKDDQDEWVDFFLEVNREQLNEILSPSIDTSIKFITELLNENSLQSNDLASVLLVGGSTYIPLVRQKLKETLGNVDTRIDPISAVAVGASFYAATRNQSVKTSPVDYKKTPESSHLITNLKFKFAYQKQASSNLEYFTAIVSGDVEGYYYRIIRKDGAFDSGIKLLDRRIEEDLPLLSNFCNQFDFLVFDDKQNQVDVKTDLIEINQGQFGILGQPLPEDICLEIDDIMDNATGLELLFKKNDVLPLRKKVIKEITKTISKGSNESIIINVLEGPQYASPTSNKPIGIIKIQGTDLTRDLIKGTEVEIMIEMTESRDLKIKTYLTLTDQEFEDSFSSSKRYVNIEGLKEEVFELMDRIIDIKETASANEDFVAASTLQQYDQQARELYDKACSLTEDDVTDTKFQIEDAKRKISYELDSLDSNNKLEETINELKELRDSIETNSSHCTPEEKKEFEYLNAKVNQTIASGNKMQLKMLTESFYKLYHKVNKNAPEYIVGNFYYLSNLPDSDFKNSAQKNRYVAEGYKAIEGQQFMILKTIVGNLINLLKNEKNIDGKSTGIS